MIDHYELTVQDIGSIYFIPASLFYFHDHFVCEEMTASWEPPPFKVVRKKAKLADFSSWMLHAPVVRNRVRELLIPFSGQDLEFLPFYITPRGEELFAMNVLTTDATRPIFKKHPMSQVYARESFGVLAREHGFTGLALADPDANNLRKIIRGESVNVFAGIAGS